MMKYRVMLWKDQNWMMTLLFGVVGVVMLALWSVPLLGIVFFMTALVVLAVLISYSEWAVRRVAAGAQRSVTPWPEDMTETAHMETVDVQMPGGYARKAGVVSLNRASDYRLVMTAEGYMLADEYGRVVYVLGGDAAQ